MNRINVICLGVKNMERSIRFYKDGLGFQTKETSYNPEVIFFDTKGGLKFELYPLELLAKDINEANPPPIGTGFSGVTFAYNVKSKEEVHEIIERARRAGAQIEKEPQDVFWGGYHAYFSDPDGYCWEIAGWDGWEFDENDMVVEI